MPKRKQRNESEQSFRESEGELHDNSGMSISYCEGTAHSLPLVGSPRFLLVMLMLMSIIFYLLKLRYSCHVDDRVSQVLPRLPPPISSSWKAQSARLQLSSSSSGLTKGRSAPRLPASDRGGREVGVSQLEVGVPGGRACLPPLVQLSWQPWCSQDQSPIAASPEEGGQRRLDDQVCYKKQRNQSFENF